MAKLVWIGERISQDSEQSGQITDDIFITGKESISQGKLSYVLPGLGAAYPNMLKDLCMHFPDVRMAFDYIDQMSLTYSHADRQTKPFSELFHILPSTKLFGIPKPGRPGPQTSAALLRQHGFGCSHSFVGRMVPVPVVEKPWCGTVLHCRRQHRRVRGTFDKRRCRCFRNSSGLLPLKHRCCKRGFDCRAGKSFDLSKSLVTGQS